jgi:hypothetical protein
MALRGTRSSRSCRTRSDRQIRLRKSAPPLRLRASTVRLIPELTRAGAQSSERTYDPVRRWLSSASQSRTARACRSAGGAPQVERAGGLFPRLSSCQRPVSE